MFGVLSHHRPSLSLEVKVFESGQTLCRVVDEERNLVALGNSLRYEFGRFTLSGVVETTPWSTVRLAQLEGFGCC